MSQELERKLEELKKRNQEIGDFLMGKSMNLPRVQQNSNQISTFSPRKTSKLSTKPTSSKQSNRVIGGSTSFPQKKPQDFHRKSHFTNFSPISTGSYLNSPPLVYSKSTQMKSRNYGTQQKKDKNYYSPPQDIDIDVLDDDLNYSVIRSPKYLNQNRQRISPIKFSDSDEYDTQKHYSPILKANSGQASPNFFEHPQKLYQEQKIFSKSKIKRSNDSPEIHEYRPAAFSLSSSSSSDSIDIEKIRQKVAKRRNTQYLGTKTTDKNQNMAESLDQNTFSPIESKEAQNPPQSFIGSIYETPKIPDHQNESHTQLQVTKSPKQSEKTTPSRVGFKPLLTQEDIDAEYRSLFDPQSRSLADVLDDYQTPATTFDSLTKKRSNLNVPLTQNLMDLSNDNELIKSDSDNISFNFGKDESDDVQFIDFEQLSSDSQKEKEENQSSEESSSDIDENVLKALKDFHLSSTESEEEEEEEERNQNTEKQPKTFELLKNIHLSSTESEEEEEEERNQKVDKVPKSLELLKNIHSLSTESEEEEEEERNQKTDKETENNLFNLEKNELNGESSSSELNEEENIQVQQLLDELSSGSNSQLSKRENLNSSEEINPKPSNSLSEIHLDSQDDSSSDLNLSEELKNYLNRLSSTSDED